MQEKQLAVHTQNRLSSVAFCGDMQTLIVTFCATFFNLLHKYDHMSHKYAHICLINMPNMSCYINMTTFCVVK
jgi:hypothetical protein